MNKAPLPRLLILNQMAGPMTWELAEDLGKTMGPVALLTGHPDTLKKGATGVTLFKASAYQRGGYGRRVLTWLLYCLEAFVWLWRWPASVPMLLFSNPPILCWLGYLMFKLRGQRYAVMVHDIYPDVLVGLGKLSKDHWLVRLWRVLNRRAYEHARVVMTLGEYMAANLDKQFDARRTPAGRVEVVYPWVDTDVIKPMPKEQNWFAQKYGQIGKLTVMYSGNMGLGHDIETMLEAARQLRDWPAIHFMFIGGGPKWQLVADTLLNAGLINVTLLAWQSESTLPYLLSTGDLALVSMDTGLQGLAIPSKAMSVAAAGCSLLLLSKRPNELQEIIEAHHCGFNIEPGDVDNLVKSIVACFDDRRLLTQRATAARLTAKHKFARIVNMQLMLNSITKHLVADLSNTNDMSL